ncbi:MAG TPA: proline dehydrogenase family protein [Thermoanaerobaculia bacterium]|jgi:proline dehydrogenase|nr:proline dehydrogenase family protein [Thermoanaerobaculia bacterium]
MNPINTLIVRTLPLVPRPVVRLVASRYVAGETLDDAIRAVRHLNSEGCMATLDVLGEDVTNLSETDETVSDYLEALEAILAQRLDSNISVKLTAYGLKLDPALCRRQFRRVLDQARDRGVFVRIDMEDSSVTEETIRIYEESRRQTDRVGLVLQAYLRRSRADVERLAPLRPNVRVCKGIYVEPAQIAFQGAEEIRDNYMAIVEDLFDAGSYVGIATHDDVLVERALATIRKRGLPREAYEFQMLLGVAVHLRRRLVSDGHRLRVYVPFGRSWHAYSLRRLKENPSIAGQIVKGFLRRG